ncbi:S8 family serine peptidase, partial [Corynebacterium durum]|uniref:S8 family serine peptidase n=1 Tax=Corynebacterium durum TaxID=61592 RepID=UPI0028ECA9E6
MRRHHVTAVAATALLLCASAPCADAQHTAAPPPPACARSVPTDPPLRADTARAASKSALKPAHAIATGRNVKVAVIDTGVAPHPRLLPRLDAGADLLGEHNPLHDCDGHGTIVAGLIAGAAGPDDYVGIAPDSTIISIRQTSAHTRDDDHGGTLESLTTAIHRALDLGAQVINISVVSCVPGALRTHPDGAKLRQGLDAALRRAEEQRTVVVAATGNIGTNCEPDSIVYPAHSSTVLAVSAQDEPHTIAAYSIPPSGVLLSAPGTTPVGLSPDVGEPPASVFAAGMVTEQGPSSFTGTSFAAPIVSGTAALLKERYPDDTALQIRARIIESADPGTGAVSPYRALT